MIIATVPKSFMCFSRMFYIIQQPEGISQFSREHFVPLCFSSLDGSSHSLPGSLFSRNGNWCICACLLLSTSSLHGNQIAFLSLHQLVHTLSLPMTACNSSFISCFTSAVLELSVFEDLHWSGASLVMVFFNMFHTFRAHNFTIFTPYLLHPWNCSKDVCVKLTWDWDWAWVSYGNYVRVNTLYPCRCTCRMCDRVLSLWHYDKLS